MSMKGTNGGGDGYRVEPVAAALHRIQTLGARGLVYDVIPNARQLPRNVERSEEAERARARWPCGTTPRSPT